MDNNIEKKITQLLRKEKLHLKSHLISYHQNFSWISLSEGDSGLSEEFSTYGYINREKDADLLSNDKKLEEEIKKKIPSLAQGLIWGLRFHLMLKICQSSQYDSSSLITKNSEYFQNLNYDKLLNLFREIDLPKTKKWICFLPTETFKLTTKRKEHFQEKDNLMQIVELPLKYNFQVIFAEITSPLITYFVDDLFCQENWNNIGKNSLFLFAKILYKITEIKGKIIAVVSEE